MATVSSGGALDVQGIVSQLMVVERQPLTLLQSKASALQSDISAFGTIKSLLSTFQDASRALMNSATWNASTATSSDDTIVGAVGTSGAIKGDLAITVQQLAQAESAVTGAFASGTTVVGGGTLTIQTGSGDPVDVTIASGATLAQVRDAINRANAGVSASLVTDNGQARLLIRSSETGLANAFSISVSNAEDGSASGLGALAYSGGGGAMTQTQAARDAAYMLDGLALTSPTNRITDAVEGVTLTLKKETATPVAVTLAADTKAAREKVDAFVSAYNALTTKLAALTKFDQASGTAGELQGNSSATRLQQQLRQLVGATVAESPLGTLSNAGIEIQRDGTLKVNDSKFEAAMMNPTALHSLFGATIQADGTGGGIAARFNSMVTRAVGVEGLITTAIDSLNARKKSNADKQDAIERRLVATQARLVRLYSTLDANLSSLQSLSAQLTNSLAALQANTKTD